MRIRKGPRCVPLADRSFSRKGLDNNALRRRADETEKMRVKQQAVVVEAPGGAKSGAATSGCQDLDHQQLANGASSSSAGAGAGTEQRLVEAATDRVLRKRLSADGSASCRKRSAGVPIAKPAGVISISSIIQAGVKSAKIEPVSAESVVTSVTTLACKSPSDCSPSDIAMKSSIADQPQGTLLLQSLKRVCSAAESTGLTAKEAVAKIQEQGLPGLIDGGERLIVQVAKSFRSSSAFVEREERGRYFIQESTLDLNAWDNFQTADHSSNTKQRDEEAESPKCAASEFDTIIEAAKQLQKLQELTVKSEPVREKAGSTNKSGTDRWVLALRGKSSGKGKEPPPTSVQKASPSPRCNRDDGKGWRCVRLAESGFSLCKYHRDQIRRAEIRRRKARNKSKKQSRPASPASTPVSPVLQPAAVKPASNPTSKDVVKAVSVPQAESKTADVANPIDSDNELPDHKRRRFVKAKSLKSLL